MNSRVLRLLMMSVLLSLGLAITLVSPVGATTHRHPCCDRILLHDSFADPADPAWTFLNRTGSIHDGRLWIDGDYVGAPLERDGWAMTHAGDHAWRNYRLQARYSSENVGGFPSEVHMTTLYVRVAETGSTGRETTYRLDLWDPGQPDPSGEQATIPDGLLAFYRFRDGVGTTLLTRRYSASRTGWNTVWVTVVGNRTTVSVNGQWMFTHRDPEPIRYGGVGVGQIWETNGVFDWVKVRAIPLRQRR